MFGKHRRVQVAVTMAEMATAHVKSSEDSEIEPLAEPLESKELEAFAKRAMMVRLVRTPRSSTPRSRDLDLDLIVVSHKGNSKNMCYDVLFFWNKWISSTLIENVFTSGGVCAKGQTPRDAMNMFCSNF